jgi:hypothetical protein
VVQWFKWQTEMDAIQTENARLRGEVAGLTEDKRLLRLAQDKDGLEVRR